MHDLNVNAFNRKTPFIHVHHNQLERLRYDDPFKSWCDACSLGALVCRYPDGNPADLTRPGALSRYESCTHCSQDYIYDNLAEIVPGFGFVNPIPLTIRTALAYIEVVITPEERSIVSSPQRVEDIVAQLGHLAFFRANTSGEGLYLKFFGTDDFAYRGLLETYVIKMRTPPSHRLNRFEKVLLNGHSL